MRAFALPPKGGSMNSAPLKRSGFLFFSRYVKMFSGSEILMKRVLNTLRFSLAWPIYCVIFYPVLIAKALWSRDKKEWHEKPWYFRVPLCVLRAILLALYFPLIAVLGWFIITVDTARGRLSEEQQYEESEWLVARMLNTLLKAPQ